MVRSRLAEQVGRVVGGRYRILAPIGGGASADVYVADDVTLRRRVAVKVLRDALGDDDGFLRRFRAEAQAVASLRHPNIVTVYDWGEEPDSGPFMVLEYLGGGSLRGVLDRGVLLTPSQAVLVGLEAARGLDYAHRRGLVHRDVKPANLLFDDEGRLAIADFGIARALAEATWTEPAGAVVGTVRYASPEQVRGQSVDGRADVYALALLLVEATTGAVPFSADTTIATLMARLDGPIVAPASLGPLAAVIDAAGTVDPTARLDAAQMVRALERAAESLPRPARLPLDGRVPVPRDELDPTTGFTAVTEAPPVPTVAPAPEGDATPPSPAATAPAPTPDRAVPLEPPPAAPDGPAVIGPAPPRIRRRRRRWPVVAVVLVAAAAAAAFVVLRPRLAPTYAVPSLAAMTAADAGTHAGPHFHVIVHHERVTGARVGVVLDQHPAAATRHRSGVITVDVSDGNAAATVPDLTGLTLASAQQALQAAGLQPRQTAPAYSSTVPAGQIASWSPRAQAYVGDPVDLTVSQGPEFVSMPDVVSIPTAAAQAATQLQSLGIPSAAIVETQIYSDTVPVGDVIATTPTAGSPADRSGTVVLEVSKGPEVKPVPEVRGKRVADAELLLRQDGFVPQTYGPPGRSVVVDQQPVPGTPAKVGSQVLLVAF